MPLLHGGQSEMPPRNGVDTTHNFNPDSERMTKCNGKAMLEMRMTVFSQDCISDAVRGRWGDPFRLNVLRRNAVVGRAFG